MAIKKVLAGASLVLLALAAAPTAYAQNDSDGLTVTNTKPHKVVDPAKKAARQAKRKARREARRQAQLQQNQGLPGPMPAPF